MAVASYCYYENVTELCALQLYRISLSIFIPAQEFSYEESDYGDIYDEDIEHLYTWQVK